MTDKLAFQITALLVLIVIIISVCQMIIQGINPDKINLCVWALIALIWCKKATEK